MAKIQRKTQKIFCGNAENDQLAVFGSMATGTPVYTNDIEQLQNNEAYLQGWESATLEDKAPFMEEMNGLQYGLSKQIAYTLQEGIPEYDANTTYYIGSIVKALNDGKPILYTSIIDNNIGNALSDATAWEELKLGGGSGFNLFDTKLSDHILEGEEAKGWALQGTYVYKEGVSGVRDGYPDFYNKVIEEYNEAILTETVNGVTVKVNSNGHKFYDITDKSTIDEVFNNTGLAWFYGIDTENERVFLPRNAWFEQMTADTLEVGDSVEAGLPNITGLLKIAINEYSVSGAFTASAGGGKDSANGDDSQSTNFNFDASLSNLIYGNSDTVQPNAVKKLLYICVGNTNVETAVTEVVDVTTTENDTVPLFTGMYFDFKPNNLSWLKAGEQVNSGGLYTTAYNELVNCLNGVNKYNLQVINIADMVSGVDYSEYWKVNQDELYFITPTKLSYGALTGGVLGNGMTLGLTNGTENYGLITDTRNSYPTPSLSLTAYGTEIGTRADNDRPVNALTYGIAQDVTKSGIIAEQSTVELYFKVANAVQNLELLNVGEVMEAMTDKIGRQDCVAYITESFVDGTSGYNVYSNGYCEQWGTYGTESQTGVDSNQTITLLKPYKDANYSVMCAHQFANSTYNSNAHIYSKTNTNFVFTTQKGINYWQTKGYIS